MNKIMVKHYSNRRCILAQYIEFTPEQKERAATVNLEEFLLCQGEKLIKSGREKRLASDHSVTVRGCEWFDHASNEGGRAVSFVQKFYGKSYAEARKTRGAGYSGRAAGDGICQGGRSPEGQLCLRT